MPTKDRSSEADRLVPAETPGAGAGTVMFAAGLLGMIVLLAIRIANL